MSKDQKPRIIQSVMSLAPEAGGPARTVSDLSLALADLGVSTTILTVDIGEHYSAALIPDHDLIEVISLPALVQNGMRPLVIPGFKRALEGLTADSANLLIHDHGIWLPQNWLVAIHAVKHNIPLVVSPDGMLEPGAVAQKWFKKRIAWYLIQRQLLQRSSALHATSQVEKEHLQALGLTPPVGIIPNGTLIPPSNVLTKKSSHGPIRLLFLSRIHPIKGLLTLIQSLVEVQEFDWRLVIVGYDEVNHMREVNIAAQRGGIIGRITYAGPVKNQDKWQYYHDADIFILPSFSENFGMVVAEALAAGIPVITTTSTPWADIQRYDCGWWVEPSVSKITEALKAAFLTPSDELTAMGQRGRKLIEEHYSWKVIGKEMLEFYQDVLAQSSVRTGVK